MSDEDKAAWRQQHAPDCCKNFDGSSKAMEQEAAKRIWSRSLKRHNIRYTQMLSDGDSTAFKAVVEAKPYGEVSVEKLECINHAHKRMGTALRKLTKEKRLGGRGKGRLTAAKCNNLQNYYRGAILDNLGNLESMRAAIWAGLFHSMSTDENPHHTRCGSWCWYRKALDAGEVPPSHDEHPGSTYVTAEVAEQMVPVYRRMSDESLLKRMQHGGTQNTNECLNSVIWSRCPKTTFVGKRRVEAAVGMAVTSFNEGASAISTAMDSLWMESTAVTLTAIKEEDALRMAKADAASLSVAKRRRKSADAAKKIQRHQQEMEEGATYAAGMAD